jgi:NADPH2:quinone reductase
MKSIYVKEFSESTEVMEVRDVPVPDPGQREVRVAVKAAGINYADLMQRYGSYPNGPQPPYAAGFEIAGTVDALGAEAKGWNIGDRVMGLCSTGGYSEYAVTRDAGLMKVPDSLSFEEAAAIPCQYLTAYHVLFTLSGLKAGQTVLIQAAAGGLGTVEVQLAKLAGATVIGTCSTPEKIELIKSLGCDHPINYKESDFRKEVERITEGKGVELVVETVGGRVFDLSLRCLKPHGRLVVVGVASGDSRPVYGAYLLPNNLTVSGFHLNGFLGRREAMAAAAKDLYHWLEEGKLAFQVNHTFPLEKAAQAHEKIAARETSGKVVLVVGD